MPLPRYQLPLRRTSSIAFSSRASVLGQLGKGSRRTGVPPSKAGVSFSLAAAVEATVSAAPVVVAVARNRRRSIGAFIARTSLESRWSFRDVTPSYRLLASIGSSLAGRAQGKTEGRRSLQGARGPPGS